MRCAVVGHVEVVEFARVPRLPDAGQIARASEVWSEPAGGGAVIAAQMMKLAGRCEFFTALGDDELGRRAVTSLAQLGLDVHAQHFGTTRRAFTHVDDTGERTITVLGEKLLPRGPLPLHGYDAVFFVAGDVAALRSARAARFLAATPRELPTLLEGGVRIDLLVGSGTDPGERYEGGLDAGLVVRTEGVRGGTVNNDRYEPAELPGPIADTYGAGDSFAAALCFALGRGDTLDDALALATRAGAGVLTGKGPYTAQISG
ncbi:MAG TPA: PfkB family carbohydrate kinase [Gaiellaceae bacterium]|nr:PfkB family carbohydrate kinase [Gaiellaceae bacterium]